MNTILSKLRLDWFIFTHTLSYTANYLERVYSIYLNHNKVIHYRNGHPVFSLSTPPLLSKPAANFFARSLFRTIQNKNIPNMMSFAVNDICNANCKSCSFYSGVYEKGRKLLNLEQSQQLLKDAQELGVSVINLVGGEPTLREDLPDIIQNINKDLSTVIMFTNGSVLTDRVEALQLAGLDGVYVSIDSADPKKHDILRGRKGLFDEAIAGIRKAKAVGLSTGISSCLTPESFKSGELEEIIELGRSIGVHEILVFDAMPTGRYKHRKDLVDNPDWVEEMIKVSHKYNQDARYPGILVWAYATSHRSVGCSCGTSYFYVSPYGDVMSCDFNHAKFGNILEIPLYRIWDEMTSMTDFRQAKWGGCKIKDSEFRKKETVSAGNGCSCRER